MGRSRFESRSDVLRAEEFLEDILSFEASSFASDNLKIGDPSHDLSSENQVGTTSSLFEQFISYGGNGINKTSNSCPPDLPQLKHEPLHINDIELHALAKDRQKKDNHNMTVELNTTSALANYATEAGQNIVNKVDRFLVIRFTRYYEIVRDVRPNKGTILKSSVDYIKVLKHDVHRMKQVEARQKQLEFQNRRLLLRVQELELQAKANGLHVSEFDWQSCTPVGIVTNTYMKPDSLLQNPLRKIPDLITKASTLSVAQMEELMDDNPLVKGDPMLSSHVQNPGLSENNMHNMDSIDSIDDELDDSNPLTDDIEMIV
uniref:(California timema) hypothetical protein n=1 Tax=Timema californicum TaxID=61474 RepID=A0A7R9JB20_TIMCA|nr:unnamed protein product [Timema californicum]